MKSAVETLSPTRAKLTVEVPFEELKPSLDAAYKKIAQQINVPGFRKGKVPPMVIDRQIGRGPVLDEAINEALPKLYVQALQDNDIEPLAQPEIDITKFEDNESLEFTVEVDVRPEITLPDLEGLEVTVDDIEVTDEDVDTQVETLRERFATLNEVERAAAEGDHQLGGKDVDELIQGYLHAEFERWWQAFVAQRQAHEQHPSVHRRGTGFILPGTPGKRNPGRGTSCMPSTST